MRSALAGTGCIIQTPWRCRTKPTLPTVRRRFPANFELALFHDWLCETHLGIEFGASEQAGKCLAGQFVTICSSAIRWTSRQVFVHRDYHSRNLMVNDDR